MLIYCESILGRTVFVTPYNDNIDSSNMNKYVDRAFMMQSHLVMLQNFRESDAFITLKNRYEYNQLDKSWHRGTILHKLDDTPFTLATLYCGNDLMSPNIQQPTQYKGVVVEGKSLEQIEEFLRCMDEIYNYL